MATVDEIDSAFEGIILAENQCQHEGYEVGLRQGEIQGYLDGYIAGQKQGAKLASELGFYEGFGKSWLHLLDSDTDKNRRKVKALKALLDVVSAVPTSNPTDSSLHERVDAVRSKFKQVCSLLNVKTTFGEKAEGLSF